MIVFQMGQIVRTLLNCDYRLSMIVKMRAQIVLRRNGPCEVLKCFLPTDIGHFNLVVSKPTLHNH